MNVNRLRATVIIVSCLLQAGIAIISIVSDNLSGSKIFLQFVAERLKAVSMKAYADSQRIVENAFRQFLPSDWESNPHYSDVGSLIELISDLLLASREKTNLVTFYPLPRFQQLQNKLPAELFLIQKT